MRAFWTMAILASLWGCGSGDDGRDRPDGDVVLDWGEWPDLVQDTGSDIPADGIEDTGTDPVVTGPGQYRTQIPSAVAPGDGIAIRVSYPAAGDARHVEGAPVVVLVPGGLGAGSLGWDEPDPLALATGTVVVSMVLPGGREPGAISGGTYDYRGPDCKAGLRDVLLFALGTARDEDGWSLADRVPFADTSVVGMVGLSHGGNLALTTLADHSASLAGLDFLATWESPVGDQYVTAELGGQGDVTDNPFYSPGTCTITTCPWPGLDGVLDWATGHDAVIEDPLDGTLWPISGSFFLDVDGNEVLGDNEFLVKGIAGPGEWHETDYLPWLYYSTEMASILDDELATFFPLGKPVWMASPEQIRDYWAERDGALVIGDVHDAWPDLLIMVLGTVDDHVQVQPDHPHLRSQMDGFVASGHAWVRLDPDAVYVAWLSGTPAADIPELDAGQALPWPDTETHLIPEALQEHIVPAAVLELVDRSRTGNVEADLDAMLF